MPFNKETKPTALLIYSANYIRYGCTRNEQCDFCIFLERNEYLINIVYIFMERIEGWDGLKGSIILFAQRSWSVHVSPIIHPLKI